MNRYTVVWEPDADNDVAELWMAAPNPDAVTSAIHRVIAYLSHEPEDCGEELREGLRVLNVPPLRVIYSVRPEDRLVEIDRVTWLEHDGS